MSDYLHGPEYVEHTDGPTTIRDIKSGVTYLNGTAPIGDVHADAAARAPYINQPIIIRSRIEAAAAFGEHTEGFTIPEALDAVFDQGAGGTIVVNNVFNPDTHDEVGDVTGADLIGGIDAQGIATGMSGAYACFNRFGFFPKIYLSAMSSTAGVRVEMDQIAHRLLGHAVCDLPVGLTIQEAIEARGVAGSANTSSSRTILTYPNVKVYDGAGDERLEPLSNRFAGVMIASDLERGWHHSPSNREIRGVIGTEVPVSFYPGDHQNDTDLLNDAGIVTVMNSYATGFRTWGNRSAAHPTSTYIDNFIHARRIMDQIHEAITFFVMQYIDRLTSPQNIEALEEGVNAYLRTKIGDNVLFGATFRFNHQKNTAEVIAGGRVYYLLETHPITVGERITTDFYVDTKFITNALALAA